MHQTFYIDIDEEITSVVDRLRRSKSKEVVIVVPKRALLIQSIINLKLLKKESDKLKKKLTMVTQDKLGKMLIEKVGIEVEEKLDSVEGEEEFSEDKIFENKNEDELIANVKYGDSINDELKHRLENLGSDSYFGGSDNNDFSDEMIVDIPAKASSKKLNNISAHSKLQRKHESKEYSERNDNKITVKNIDDFPKKSTSDIVKTKDVEKNKAEEFEAEREEMSYVSHEKTIRFRNEDFVDNFFQPKKYDTPKNTPERLEREVNEIELSHSMRKVIFAIGFVVVSLGALVGGYIFLPSVDIKITLKTQEKSFDAQIKASQSITDVSSESIPASLVSIEDQYTQEYAPTGSKSSAGQKAKGTITIYNEYSNSPQPLIATTRFATDDGKIFRLVNGVTIPGATSVNGEMKAGAIDASVVADSAGGEYNIDPTTFSIPGFKGSGSEKYSKFYAKSSQAMSGGGDSGTMINSISEADIANAKSKALDALLSSIKDKMQTQFVGKAVMLDDAFDAGTVTYDISNSIGDAVDKFKIVAKTKARAMVFDEYNLKKALVAKSSSDDKNANNISNQSVSLQYGKADIDFTNSSLLIRVHADQKTVAQFDKESFKKDIAGKSNDDLAIYLKKYPDVSAAEVSYWPSFIAGKIPLYESRINMTIDNK